MNPLIPSAYAQYSAPPPGADMMQFVFLIGLFLIFYFLLIRPQRKRQKEHADMVGKLAKGDEVQTEGGMMGKITDIGDTFVKVEVAEGTVVAFRRQSIAAVMPKGTLKEI